VLHIYIYDIGSLRFKVELTKMGLNGINWISQLSIESSRNVVMGICFNKVQGMY